MPRRDAVLDELVWTCGACGKATHTSRKKARAVARKYHPGERMRAYWCDAGQGYHNGHLRELHISRGVPGTYHHERKAS